MGRETLWWGGCAWDSFAVPHLVDREPEVLVSTQCPCVCRASRVGRRPRRTTERDAGRALPHTRLSHVGRRGAHVRTPTDLLRRSLRRRVAQSDAAQQGLCHGPRDAVAPCPRLVCGSARSRLRAARPDERRGVLRGRRAHRSVLGLAELDHVSSTPSRATMYDPGITRSRQGTTSRMPNASAVGESQPGMMLGS